MKPLERIEKREHIEITEHTVYTCPMCNQDIELQSQTLYRDKPHKWECGCSRWSANIWDKDKEWSHTPLSAAPASAPEQEEGK